MPTLQDLTLAHSRRLSEVYRVRDEKLADAHADRDARLHGLPGAAKHLQKYRDELADARGKQLSSDARAGAMRASSLGDAGVHRSDLLEDAHATRQATDLGALESRHHADEEHDRKHREALENARSLPDSQRSRALQEADRDRRVGMEAAKREHDHALTGGQKQFRASVEEAIKGELRSGRDTDRAYYDALRLAEAAVRAAIASAEQNLQAALMGLEGAPEILREWRLQVAAINIEAARAEQEEFSRFRRELDATTSR
jgi:hypothetical protein